MTYSTIKCDCHFLRSIGFGYVKNTLNKYGFHSSLYIFTRHLSEFYLAKLIFKKAIGHIQNAKTNWKTCKWNNFSIQINATKKTKT